MILLPKTKSGEKEGKYLKNTILCITLLNNIISNSYFNFQIY